MRLAPQSSHAGCQSRPRRIASILVVALASLLCLTLAACTQAGPAPSVTSTPEAPAAESPAPSLTPASLPGSEFPADQAGTLADLIEQASELRGLTPKGGFEKHLIGRQAAADYLEKTLDPGDRQLLARKQEVYRLLGLIPDDADLLQLQISLLRGLVLGFYDPDVKALFVLQDLGLNSVVTRATIVHEVVHALQDQYYDLNAVDLRIRDDWDMSMAYTDLVEGDARGIETEYLSPSVANNEGLNCNDSSFSVNRGSEVPAVIQRELQAPYSDGRCFDWRIQRSLPEGVDSIFKSPPRSTEQVLHPEKYLAGEEPLPIDLPPLVGTLGPGWRQADSSTFGEFALQNLLLLGVNDTATVKSAAAGWGGDRWALYERDDGARLLHLQVTWDSEADAREFWEVLLQSLASRSQGKVFANPLVSSVRWQASGRIMLAAFSGADVNIVVSTDASAAQAAAQALAF